MHVYRITRAPFVKEALTGEGARRDGGRWNSRGTRMVYCAPNRALAVLEILVHVDPDIAPDDLVLLDVEIPDDIMIPEIVTASLPTDWRESPAPEAMADIGDAWVREASSLALLVPSAVLPAERCLLINPEHPQRERLRIISREPLILDPRLL